MLPIWFLKSCIVEFLPIIVKLVNQSFATGHFPTLLKSAILIKQHNKKCSINHDKLKNYRPASNIQFISKIFEKIVTKKIDEYLVSNNLFDQMQSAYKINRSTETVIGKLHNDII